VSAQPQGESGRLPAGRFEWLQTEASARPQPEREGAEAEEARRCRRCGWLDSFDETECFRCGEAFPPPGAEEAATAAELPVDDRGAVAVDLRPARELLEPGPGSAPADWLLRRRSAERSLLPGFDQLLALGQVDPDHFLNYAHQQAVARKVLRDMGGSTLLADETGLGKTIEAGLVIKELLLRGLAQRVLIVVPASLAFQWREEMAEKFRLDFQIAREPADLRDDPPLVIVSYAGLRRGAVGRMLRERAVDLLVCDEAHHLKNRATKQHKAVARVRKKYCLLLSATPFHNRLIELKNLLDVLKPGLLGSTRAFNKQYVDEKDPRRPRNLHHLRALLSEVMIRNRRGEVAVKLPPRRAAVYHIELTPAEQEFYDHLTAFIRGEVRSRTADAAALEGRPMTLVLALINLQRELCSSPQAVGKALRRMSAGDLVPLDVAAKLAELADRAEALPRWRKAEAVDEVLDQFPGKFVVFCEFRATIAALVRRLRARGIEVEAFHGGMSGREKAAALQRFRERARVLVASRAGAEGLNIQFCSTVLNFDLPWNPMVIEQRIGRVHRLGQLNPVTVFNLSVKGTIEARVLELLTSKLRLFTAVLGEVDLILGSLHSERSFEDLLREAWLKGATDEGLDRALDRFGDELARARSEYDSIKEAEGYLDTLVAPRRDPGGASG